MLFSKSKIPLRYLKRHFRRNASRRKYVRFTLGISLIDFVKDKMSFFDTPKGKMEKYWDGSSPKQIIENADRLFDEEQYLDVYESLNRIKYCRDIEVVWRIAKALYNLSLTHDLNFHVKQEMIDEAYDILETSAAIGEGKANYHKWLAIITYTKSGLVSLEYKISSYSRVKDHLLKACEINPKDFTVQYMLGRWNYEMANLTWFQRKIANYLFLEPPKSTYHEAYKYLNRAEELQPRAFLPNLYYLGSVCIKLGQYYRAKYYLSVALSLPSYVDCDKCCISNAKSLLEKLEKYDLGKDLLFENYGFGFGG